MLFSVLLMRWKVNELRWHMCHEPYAIGAAAKDMARSVHLTGADGQQDRCSVASPDFECDLRFRGEVDVVTLHFEQAMSLDGVDESGGGSVVEEFGRFLWCILQVDLDGMPLARPDPQSIGTELEAPF